MLFTKHIIWELIIKYKIIKIMMVKVSDSNDNIYKKDDDNNNNKMIWK